MNSWTLAAREELNQFLATIRQPLEQAGADAAEVIDDIRRHVEQEVAAARLRVVTVTELKPLLARIGEPWQRKEPSAYGDKASAGLMLHAYKSNGSSGEIIGGEGGSGGTAVLDRDADEGLGQSAKVAEGQGGEERDGSGGGKGEPPERKSEPGNPPQAGREYRRPSYFHTMFGVFIPAFTLIFEWLTGFCAQNVFNPIPTWGHIVLVALVPTVNGLAFWALARNLHERHGTRLSVGLGMTTGIGVAYSIAYIPLALPGLATALLGVGLLPLAPYFGLNTSLTLRKELQRRLTLEKSSTIFRFWPGLAAGFVLFLFVDMRHLGTTTALHLTASPGTEKVGFGLLRAFGDEQTLLRACHSNRSREFQSVLFWIMPNQLQVDTSQARRVYFQLYGRAFNSVPAPRPRMVSLATFGRQPFDPERGGDKVGSPVSGLSMKTSRIDATVEPNAALSYLEWIFEFKNVSANSEEARFEVELPPGAVVSRLTLWINGEEREAAFAGKEQVRAAYRNVVVVQRRDPVLVTSSGKDRVLVQCFPVLPNGGEMKVRVGMTVPLLLDAEKNGILRWPYIRERNFALAEKLEHSFWIDSSVPVEGLNVPITTERTTSGHYMARGSLNERKQAGAVPTVLVRRSALPDQAWAADTRAGDGSRIVQRIAEAVQPAVKDIVVVLDGSASMAPIAEQLRDFRSPTRSLRVIVAGEHIEEFTWDYTDTGGRALRKVQFIGGKDNIRALEWAWDVAAQNGSGAVIWIHGPQPEMLSSAESLKQRFERRRRAVRFYDLAIERGPNVIAPALPPFALYEQVSMHRKPAETLESLVNELTGVNKKYTALRQRVDGSDGSAPLGAESNLHLARLWANDQVSQLVRKGATGEAIELAAKYQLVTEVSGAVVLETAEQYKQAGLQPVSPNTVPSVPEPGTWALLLLGMAVIGMMRRKRRARA